MKKLSLTCSIVCIGFASTASADGGGLGIRAGVGTDISLGVAVGVGVSYAFDLPAMTLDIGPEVFYHNSSESSEEFGNVYDEETWLTIFSLRANGLWGYDPYDFGVYFTAGTGLAVVLLEWEETSTDDPTANDSFEGTTAALLLNVGIGYTLGIGLDVRLEVPVLVFVGENGGASSVALALTGTAGFRF